MNEENLDYVDPAAGDLLGEVSGAVPEDTPVEVIAEVVEPELLFLTKPFDDYTTTEGLLLILVILVILSFCGRLLKGGFYWL